MRRLNCEKYPCHFLDQDCAFCFCPFYPCADERTRGCFVGGAWSCDGCIIIHRQDVAEMVIDGLLRGENISEVWKKVEMQL